MKILLLVHRLPFPPNKGDKVRSYHLLRHLASRHEVHLGTFVDDADDWQHVPRVRELCAGLQVCALRPRRAKLSSLRGLFRGEPLSLPYYRDAALRRWVEEGARRVGFDAVVVFSSSMAQYATPLAAQGVPMLVDFVDVDSAKWSDYAPRHAWPLSWLYRREGARLLAYEQAVAAQARCSFFVTDAEVALFERLSLGRRFALAALCNGVDADFFAPDAARPSPFDAGEFPVVFTGAMDYWPNIDAVQHFAHDILPALRAQFPSLRFHIVGRSPSAAVQALAGEAVRVSGTVPDVRPYLQHAAVVVAPLRLARGIQNKVLEAMAMGRPVVAARHCVDAITAQPPAGLVAADTAGDYLRELTRCLSRPQDSAAAGEHARRFVLNHCSWDAHLGRLDAHLEVV